MAITWKKLAFDADLLGLPAMSDPGADRIVFWDDSESALKWLIIGTGLAITTTTLATKDSEIVHDNLNGLDGGDYHHLTAINHTDLTDGGATVLHAHAFAFEVDVNGDLQPQDGAFNDQYYELDGNDDIEPMAA